MSEIKLNLIDANTIRHGTIHGSLGDACVAALSAEPETISELEAALARFIRPIGEYSELGCLTRSSCIDEEPYDAGIVIIDLAARIVAFDSTYSHPSPHGEVYYHDGHQRTDVLIYYLLPDDWLFLSSIEEYRGAQRQRREERAKVPPLDARPFLYGQPLSEFIASEILSIPTGVMSEYEGFLQALTERENGECANAIENTIEPVNPLTNIVKDIHVRWLLTPQKELRDQSPRDVMMARKDLIDADLHSRVYQWSMLLEGPPCLAKDSYAYRFAGFGSHEWIIYYELVRELIWNAVTNASLVAETGVGSVDLESTVAYLEEFKSDWLEKPMEDDDNGRIPAQVIDNERKRLPEAMGGRSMVIDEDCPCCKWMGDEAEAGLAVYFWHLDGCNMDEDFAFSFYRTHAEWEDEQKQREELSREFDRKWQEREERLARGETLEHDPLFDPANVDDVSYWGVQLEPELPES